MQQAILVVDDDGMMRERVRDLLSDHGYEIEEAASGEEALEKAADREFACVLTDMQMPGMGDLDLIGALHDQHPEMPAVMMTGFGSIERAVEAMRLGAEDFITKPFESERLRLTIERALEKRALEEESRRLRAAVERTTAYGDLVGKSAAMNEIYALIRKIAGKSSSVLITGESGTGKEVVARTIHLTGNRAHKPFVAINCTAMPEGLLESELFGHVRGAFSGARSDKKGLFVEANGGTLLLDEISDMSPTLQGKLLRVLQEQQVRPVGGDRSIHVDVRVIAATHRNLRGEVEQGKFREDLYYRLNVIPIHIPPLRERPEDVPVLARAFVERHSKGARRYLSERAMQKLQNASWPGNARELENCIERSLALASGFEILEDDIGLSEEPLGVEGSIDMMILRLAQERQITLHELKERYIDSVLESTSGRKCGAARILGINRRTLYRREERQAARKAD